MNQSYLTVKDATAGMAVPELQPGLLALITNQSKPRSID